MIQVWVLRGWGGPRSLPRPVLRVPSAPRAVPQDLVGGCQQSAQGHCTFSPELLELQQWVIVVTCWSPSGSHHHSLPGWLSQWSPLHHTCPSLDSAARGSVENPSPFSKVLGLAL